MAWLGFAWLLFLLAAASWLVASFLVPLLTRFVLSPALVPALRGQRLWLITALPWLLPLTVITAVCVLAAGQKFGWIHDHCPHHGPGHPHLCFEHLPQLLLSYPQAFIASLVASGLLLLAGRFVFLQRRRAKRIASLNDFARGSRYLRVVDDARVLGFAAGLRKPKVFLSRGLLQQLTLSERRIVLAHELAHLRNRDLLKNLTFELLMLLHSPWAVKRLRACWRQVMEERADDRVAKRFGRTAVASTLLTVSKAAVEPMAVSVAGADPLRRIQRLLSPQLEYAPRGVFVWVYFAVVFAAGVATVAAHHDLETLLGILA